MENAGLGQTPWPYVLGSTSLEQTSWLYHDKRAKLLQALLASIF